jgi:diguanylate cyclase (GGDEF)-like protein/PAS domain S-box-containing protein
MKKHAPHLLVTGLLAVVLLTDLHQGLRNFINDFRYAWPGRSPSGEVVVVAIDPASIEKIGVWPWSRHLHADLVRKLNSVGANEIAFDVDFSSASDPEADASFRDALRDAQGAVILPAFKQVTRTNSSGLRLHQTTALKAFFDTSWPAGVNVPIDGDGIARRYFYETTIDDQTIPSLAALLAGSRSGRGTYLIDFGIQQQAIPIISFIDVLERPKQELSWLAGKKIVVGATAIELGDRLNTPNGKVLPGVVFQALAAESIIQDRTLEATSWLLSVGLSLGVILIALFCWPRVSHWPRAGLLVLLAVFVEASAVLLQYSSAIVVDTALVHASILGYLAIGAVHEIDLRGLLSSKAEDRFRRMAISVSDGLACIDRTGAITFWNPGAEKIFGRKSDEISGKPLTEIFTDAGDSQSLLKELLSSSGTVVELLGRRADEKFPLEARFFSWEGAEGQEYGLLLRDISERKREAERINYLAKVDAVTGLANRHALKERLMEALAVADKGHEVAILVLDLDRFKEINDSMGHTSGDQLLASIGTSLTDLLQGVGFVARLGGDEFAIVLSGVRLAREMEQVAAAICDHLKSETFSVPGGNVQVKASIGIAIFPSDADSAERLLSNADHALYQAKEKGGGNWCFFTHKIEEEIAAKLALQTEVGRALKQQEFELFYQPQMNLRDRTVGGAEALIRWRHPHKGVLAPAKFLPVVHGSAYSNDVGWWVLEAACRQAAAWQKAGRNLCVAVNLSPSQLHSDLLVERVAAILSSAGLPAKYLDLEVTEDTLISDEQRALDLFGRLRRLGVALSFDDFGTGYGGLSYLRKFQFDHLKIDRSFVGEMRKRRDDASIVKSTIELSHQLGLRVVAEGIEDGETADWLSEMGCDLGQGYYFSRPLPSGELDQWLRDWRSDELSRAAVA